MQPGLSWVMWELGCSPAACCIHGTWHVGTLVAAGRGPVAPCMSSGWWLGGIPHPVWGLLEQSRRPAP